MNEDGEFLLYQAEDGQARLQVRLASQTLWLTQQQLADLYQSTPQNITQHIRAIYNEGELHEAATCKPYLQVRAEGGRQVSRSLKHYNLDVVLAVGYRVRSHRGVQFRQWATATLKGYLVKGFALDDERFKRGEDEALDDDLLRLEQRVTEAVNSRNLGYFDAEVHKLDAWAVDLKSVLEIEVKELDREIKEVQRTASVSPTLEEKVHWQKRQRALEDKRNQLRRRIFDRQDEIDEQRNLLIAELEGRLSSKSALRDIYKLQWEMS